MRQKHPALIKLGERIREIRKVKGFSQENFAREVRLDRTYMGSVERGERNIAALNLIRIAKALKIEVGDLFPSTQSLITDQTTRKY
jgi:transcriptional regulator with XRE-family HTH domain